MSSSRLVYPDSVSLVETRSLKGWVYVDPPLYPPALPPLLSARPYPPSPAYNPDMTTINPHEGIYAHQKWRHSAKPPFSPQLEYHSSMNKVLQTGSGPKAKRKRITPVQLSVLSGLFEVTDTPSFNTREETGAKLGMSNREVQIWFQNRRAKVNRQKMTIVPKSPASGQPARKSSCVDPRLPKEHILIDALATSSAQGDHFPSTSYLPITASSYNKCDKRFQSPWKTPHTQKCSTRPPEEAQNSPAISSPTCGLLELNGLLSPSQHFRITDVSYHKPKSPPLTCTGEKEIRSRTSTQSRYQSLAGPQCHGHNLRGKTDSPCPPPDSSSSYVSKRICGREEDEFRHANCSADIWREKIGETTDDQLHRQSNRRSCSSCFKLTSAPFGCSCGRSKDGLTSYRLGSDESLSPSDNELDTSHDASAMFQSSKHGYNPCPFSRSPPKISSSMPRLSPQREFSDLRLSSEFQPLSPAPRPTPAGSFALSKLVGSRHLPPLPSVECAGPGSFPLLSSLKTRNSYKKPEFDASLTLPPLSSLPVLRDSLPGHYASTKSLPSWKHEAESSSALAFAPKNNS